MNSPMPGGRDEQQRAQQRDHHDGGFHGERHALLHGVHEGSHGGGGRGRKRKRKRAEQRRRDANRRDGGGGDGFLQRRRFARSFHSFAYTHFDLRGALPEVCTRGVYGQAFGV